jgi:hypothetical protein
MRLLSSTDLAIAIAVRADTLRVIECNGRFGPFWSIEDDRGVIEVALTADESATRIASIKERIA